MSELRNDERPAATEGAEESLQKGGQEASEEPKKRELRGLYRHVKVSVKTLDKIIIGCIALIVILLVIDLQNPGFTITFDSKGGTDVAPQQQMYGELLEVPEDPYREGYEFTGWYTDYACDVPWIEDVNTIQEDVTLYAGWAEK